MSRPGDRAENEDCVRALEKDGAALFLLADGLGGHGRGGEAARLAVETFSRAFLGYSFPERPAQEERVAAAPDDEADQAMLETGFAQSQRALLDAQRSAGRGNGLKSTLVCLLVRKDIACWGHVGDSRLYFFRGGKLAARTQDHSVPQMLVASGEIREKDIRFHEDRNRLLRVMGSEWRAGEGCVLSECVPLRAGDAFLLCSDGFWELVDEKEMARLHKKAPDAEGWLASMETAAVARGHRPDARRRGLAGAPYKMDNYSAVAITV